MSEPIRARYRIRFSKTGPLRWISHRDLVRLWERLLRRADLKLSMSEGFHPKPRMSFPSALALGVESLDEVVELELSELLEPEELTERLQADEQPGLGILDVRLVPVGVGKAQLKLTAYNLVIPDAECDAVASAIAAFRAQETIEVVRKEKTLAFNVASEIPELDLQDGKLVFVLANSSGASLKPTDLIDLLNIGHVLEDGQHLTRMRVQLENEIDSTPRVTQEQAT